MENEHKRKAVHIGMAVFALCIGRFPPWLISVACGVAFVFNYLVLPRLTKRALEREADLDRGFSLGMLIYPAILGFISLLFFENQVFLAVGWGAMAFGDGFAGLVGKKLGGPRIAWNPDKTVTGLVAFILIGSLLTFALVFLLPESSRLGLPLARWAWIIAISMVFAGLAETVRGTIDDNLAVPLIASLIAFALAGAGSVPPLPANWLLGVILVLALSVLSIVSRKIDIPGGLVGGLLGWCIFLGTRLPGLVLLFSFFVLGSIASLWRMKDKKQLGLAQENRGKRSVRHAISNGGVAAICGFLAWIFPHHSEIFTVMLAASLASAAADTLSSELGNVYGRRYVNILSLKPDQRGLDGVISLEGSLLGVLGSFMIALAALFGGLSIQHALLVIVAGVFGNLMDSVLGASLQRRGYMTNDTVNFANTLIAALFVWSIH